VQPKRKNAWAGALKTRKPGRFGEKKPCRRAQENGGEGRETVGPAREEPVFASGPGLQNQPKDLETKDYWVWKGKSDGDAFGKDGEKDHTRSDGKEGVRSFSRGSQTG